MHSRTYLIPAVVCVLLVVGIPVVTADEAHGDNCGAKLCDSSGNGHGLHEEGTPGDRSTPAPKYAGGYDFDGVDDELRRTDSDFTIQEDITLAGAFEIDSFPVGERDTIVGINDVATGGGTNKFQVAPGGEIAWDSTGGPADLSSETIGTGFYTFTARAIDQGGPTRDIQIHVYDETGTEVVDFRIENRDKPTVIDDGQTFIGTHDGGIYEVRLWDELVDPAALEDLADPQARGLFNHENTAAGNEEALWFFWGSCGTPTCDSSGYDRGLTAQGFPSEATSLQPKYGDGVAFDGEDDELRSPDSANFVATESMTLFTAFEIDTFLSSHAKGHTELVGLFDVDHSDGARLGTIQLNEQGQVVYNDNGGPPVTTIRSLGVPGFYTLTADREHDPITGTNDIRVDVRNAEGVNLISIIIEDRPAPASDSGDAEIVVSATERGGDPLTGAIYEQRFWTHSVSQDRLSTISDPLDRGPEAFETTLAGTERGLWFLGD